MDFKRVFHHLSSNTGMPSINVDYAKIRFSFNTVFHFSYFHYCCCPCAYENEHLTYIGEGGALNHEKYDRVVTSIKNGKCPHVDHVPVEYIVETAVYGAHLAAVLGNDEVRKQLKAYDCLKTVRGARFDLTPLEIGLLKGVTSPDDAGFHPTVNAFVNCVLAMSQNGDVFRIENARDYRRYVNIHSRILYSNSLQGRIPDRLVDVEMLPRILEYTLKNDSGHGQVYALHYIFGLRNHLFVFNECAISAILFNKPSVLEQILTSMRPSTEMTRELHMICSILNRRECIDVLVKYNLPQQDRHISSMTDRLIKSLMKLLYSRFYDDFRDEIWKIPNQMPHKHMACQHMPFNSRSIRTLFELDIGIHFKTNRSNVLEDLLDVGFSVSGETEFRDELEIIIYENSCLNPRTSALSLALRLDSQLFLQYEQLKSSEMWHRKHKSHKFNLDLYNMDCKEHSVFGYHDSNFALSFVAPLLIECGYSCSRTVIGGMY